MLITDSAGTVHGLVDQSGNMVASYTYGPWGEILSETGSVFQPLRYSGRIYDGDTQLAIHGLRWYDPAAGVFLTPDPLAYELDGIMMVNYYRYADGDPVNRVDIGGLRSFSVRELHGPRPQNDGSEFSYKSAEELAFRKRQGQGFGKDVWAASKFIPVFSIIPSTIDAIFYGGRGIYNGDTNDLKKSATEIAGIGAGFLIPGCKAGASIALKVAKEILSIAVGYTAGKVTDTVLEDIGKSKVKGYQGGIAIGYGLGMKY